MPTLNKDTFSLQKNLVRMYSDPAVQEYRDSYMYDHIYNSSFKNNISSYSFNESGITLKINKIPGQNSQGIINTLEMIFAQFVQAVMERFKTEYGSYVCRDVYTPGVVHQQSIGELAFNCCHVLDLTPPKSDDFVIVLKYFI